MDRFTPQTWFCDPLVIVDDEGEIAFAKVVEVEFTPSREPTTLGKVVAMATTAEGWTPSMIVEARLGAPGNFLTARRFGFVLVGHDEEGLSFEWYVGGVADDYFLTQMGSGAA